MSPGPGTYETSGDNNNISFSFNKGDYEKFLYEKKKKLPGPGQYDPNKKADCPKFRFFLKKSKNKKFIHSIGTSQRKNNLENFKINDEKFPSPAEYNIPNNEKNLLDKTPVLRSRLPDLIQKSKEKLPGVGEYNLAEPTKVKTIQIKFTREARSSSPPIRTQNTPGPGAYFPLLLQKPESPNSK